MKCQRIWCRRVVSLVSFTRNVVVGIKASRSPWQGKGGETRQQLVLGAERQLRVLFIASADVGVTNEALVGDAICLLILRLR
jgi:hypothetical protein